jgi:hypothetical protein
MVDHHKLSVINTELIAYVKWVLEKQDLDYSVSAAAACNKDRATSSFSLTRSRLRSYGGACRGANGS